MRVEQIGPYLWRIPPDAAPGMRVPGLVVAGVRLLRPGLERAEVAPRLPALVEALYSSVPTGVGGRGSVSLDARELARVMADGARWAVGRGHGAREDLESIESSGAIPGAD